MHKEQLLFLANHLLGKLYPSKPKNSPNSILIVKLDEIGDAICALPAINELISQNPEANIDIMCKPYCNDVFAGISGLHQVLNSEKDWTKKYDWVVELRGTWKSLFKSIRYWPSFRFNRGTTRLRNKGKQKHEIETNFDILSPVSLKDRGKRPWSKNIKIENTIEDFRLDKGLEQFAVFHASARRVLRKWNPANFQKMSAYLWSEHQIKSVYIGVESETEQIKEITETQQEYSINAAGLFSIPELATLLKNCTLFIGNESGPLQLADYLEVPSLSFFGPGVKDIFYPKHKNARVLHYVLDCNPCDQIHCVKKQPCIDLITLSEAQASLDEIIKKIKHP